MPDQSAPQPDRPTEAWGRGERYEDYVGRWSRGVAARFVEWLGLPADSRWLDVGCGTGALSRTILEIAGPQRVAGIDQAEGFVRFASGSVADERVSFQVGDAQSLPFSAGEFDVAVSGLVLTFVPDHGRMVREMSRVVRPGGRVALYVWDYGGEMQLMRYFWDAAIETNPAALEHDEGGRFSIAEPGALKALFEGAGLESVSTSGLVIPTHFVDFDDYWRPFLGNQGTAPGYVHWLDEDERVRLRETLRSRLPKAPDGSISLTARAWAVAGTRPS